MVEKQALARYEFKRKLEELRTLSGRATELISLYIPPNRQIHEVVAYLRNEYSQSSNIKSKSTKKNVMAAIESISNRLKAYKRPPARLLAAAARTLTDRHIAPVVVHGPGEETDARRVVQEAAGASWMAPPTDLWTLTALIEGARIFVGGDTGPLHVSCSVGCPVIGVYGPTDPLVNTPWGVPFRTIHPDVAYTGVKKIDRQLGNFDDIPTSEITTTVDSFISELS